MEHLDFRNVECVLLHDRYNPHEKQQFADAVRDLAKSCGLANDVVISDRQYEHQIDFHLGEYRIEIGQASAPMPLNNFSFDLDSPYSRIVFPNARNALNGHQAYSIIRLRKGSGAGGAGKISVTPETGLFSETSSGSRSFNSTEESHAAMTFCGELAKLLIGNNPASAVYWGPSENLVPQDFFLQNCNGEMLLLNTRPALHSSSAMVDGVPTLGLELEGAKGLIGKPVIFTEAPVTFSWMYEACLTFAMLCGESRSLPQHKSTFTLEGCDWEVGVVDQRFGDEDGPDRIRLVAVHVPEFGIVRDEDEGFEPCNTVVPRWSGIEADRWEIASIGDQISLEANVFDADNELDSAMLRKLAELSTEDRNTSLSNNAPELQAAGEEKQSIDLLEKILAADARNLAPAVEQQPWQAPSQRADINALRDLVRASGDDAKTEGNGSSLIGKIGGMFARS